MNVALGEFRGSLYDTNFVTRETVSSNKKFLSIFKTCPWRIVHEIS